MWHDQQMIHYFGVFSEAVCSNLPFVLKSLVIMRVKKVRRRERPAQETQQNTRFMTCRGWHIFCPFRFVSFFNIRIQTLTFHPLSPRKGQQDVYCVSAAAAAPVSLCGQAIIQLQKPAEQSSRSALFTRYLVLLFFKNDIYSLTEK